MMGGSGSGDGTDGDSGGSVAGGRARDQCHLCGKVTDPPHRRYSCWMLDFLPDPNVPGSGWVAGTNGAIDFAAIKDTIARGRQPPACKKCHKWGHTRKYCPN